MVKRIHINQHKIRANIKSPDSLQPVITIKDGKTNTYCWEVKLLGPSKVVYQPTKPLSCGAKVWIETEGEIEYE